MSEIYLVLLEVAGIQQYVFATNKRAENAGASQLIAGLSDIHDDRAEPLGVEKVMVSSGKIIATAPDRSAAEELIRQVTTEMLISAPGVDLVGAIVGPVTDSADPADGTNNGKLALEIQRIHRRSARLRSQRPGPSERFPRLPWVAECETSGLPAASVERRFGDAQDRSAMAMAKLNAWEEAVSRFAKLLKVEKKHIWQWARQLDTADDVTHAATREGIELSLSDPTGRPVEWVGVVHADGNGIGGLLQRVSWLCPDNENYLWALDKFSTSLSGCAEEALRTAHEKVGRCPLLPLVVGGDDLTVLIDGNRALDFATAYLEAFETVTADHKYLRAVASKASKQVADWLTACAGVAIVKPHFPFASAYDLAQDLTENAKALVREHAPQGADPAAPSPFSAIDFHVLYDSTSSGFDDIRARTTIPPSGAATEERSLVRRPYITTSAEKLGELNRQDLTNERGWEQLVRLAKALSREGDNQVPRSQVVPLRAELYNDDGNSLVDHDLRQLGAWYPKSDLAGLLNDPDALGGGSPADWFLDALDVAGIGADS